ncbi:MAG: 4-aminobutyrate--2-oxoglutarate transaminase [Acidimicrobiia bacterium]|nr:4-aminobutyrate--2-oxoglutarate transaminase [Acidimicrobiia bacterium]NNL48861.1 4-aminobutyrate--2-oxoglutarate transaminase [Acidimicrobiia bacterium]
MAAIKLVTEIPGPKSLALVARREAATGQGAAKLTQLAIARAHGAVVTDVDGNTLIDLAGGIGVLATGHTPDSVVTALKSQAEELVHMCAIVASYESYVAVAEKLNEIMPGDIPKKTVLMNTGAEAVETAVKVSRAHTGRQGVVVFDGAYHGRTNMTMAMTSKFNLFKHGFGPFSPEIYRFAFPNVYRRPDAMTEVEFVDWHIENLDHSFMAIVEPSHVACVVVEPVQGEGGFIPAPSRWLQKLRSLCDEHGIVLIADEIQSGFGRTGKLFAIEHTGVVPDLVTTAKSLAAGMPLSAVTGRADIIDAAHPGGLGGTYSGNPLACVAALAAIDQINRPEFLDRAAEIGRRLRTRLEKIQSNHPSVVGDVRGVGSMLAMELVQDPDTKEPSMEAAAAITAETTRRGVITIRAGLYSNCVRFLPPLVISNAELDEALDVVEASVADLVTGAYT